MHFMPSPWHASQRPPLTLNEKRPGLYPRSRLSGSIENRSRIGENNDWGGAPALTAAFNQVGAFQLPGGSRDAAVLVTLAPGNYTVEVSGVGNTTGTALVEVYEVP